MAPITIGGQNDPLNFIGYSIEAGNGRTIQAAACYVHQTVEYDFCGRLTAKYRAKRLFLVQGPEPQPVEDEMLQDLIQLCTSRTGLSSFLIMSDLAIAASYFAIPLTMAVVFRKRKDDIPYAWLWILFVAFIVACGLTHLAHVWSAFWGVENLAAQAAINFLCAAVSVGTAVAFAYIIPQINELPSPKKQRAELERLVRQRTREKDILIHEINHRIGNQLQVLSSIVSIESRGAKSEEAVGMLSRLKQMLDKMGEEHIALQASDYLAVAEINSSVLQ